MIKALIFDWGNTIMRDFPELEGPMYLWKNVELIPDIKPALEYLSKKYLCCIATNAGCSDTEAMIKALKRVDVDKYFKHFYSSKDLGYSKPDKRFFTSILKNINRSPEECIMIGNDYKKDIYEAKNSGMKTIFFNEDNLKGDFTKADFVINSMSILIKTVEDFEN
ncbi:MAG: HAD-IA family hydrolase [Bacteroidales bacterium]|nr:HAD-IA family hydrolase [Bacteroidales bacterium]